MKSGSPRNRKPRKEIARSQPPQRKKYLARSTKPIKQRGKRKCYQHLRNEPFKQWARETYPCEVRGKDIIPGVPHRCAGRLEFAHVEGEGIGGADVGNGVILCTEAHTAAPWSLHRDGRQSFERRFNVDLEAIAMGYVNEYRGAA